MSSVSWSELGLGRGIDGSHRCSMRSGALSVIVSPRDNLVEELRAGAGYKSFEAKILAESTIQRELTASLECGEFTRLVKLDFGIESLSRQYEGRLESTARGEQIHNRTIRIRRETFASLDLAHSRTKEDAESSHCKPSSFLEEVLQEKRQTTPKPSEESQEWRVQVCKRCIQDPRIGGATHFISSLDLGAKVFKISTASIRTEKKQFCIQAKTGNAGIGSLLDQKNETAKSALSLGVGFNEESMKKASVSGSRYQAIIHPDVQLNEMHTKIEPEQERTIGFELSPVASVLPDPVWREAMKTACRRHIEEKVAQQPARVGQEGPFMLKCGSFYLREEGGHICVTCDVNHASPFYILTTESPGKRTHDIVEDPYTCFNIVFRTDSGMALFLCTSTHSKEVVLRHHPLHQSEASFYLTHLCSHNPASLQDWSQRSLMVYRQTRFTRQKQYLAIVSRDEDTNDNTVKTKGLKSELTSRNSHQKCLAVRGVSNIFRESRLSQFQLQNYTDFPKQCVSCHFCEKDSR